MHTLKKREDVRSFSAIAGYCRGVEAMMTDPQARVAHQDTLSNLVEII
ncbi:hypothetical protein AB4307_18975 [Vibrio sp. 10N.261.52.C2]|nr:hypothetical protein [Vibrio crassostreae]